MMMMDANKLIEDLVKIIDLNKREDEENKEDDLKENLLQIKPFDKSIEELDEENVMLKIAFKIELY